MFANAMALPNASLLAVYRTAIGEGAFSRPPCLPPVGPLTDASLTSHRAERPLGRVPSPRRRRRIQPVFLGVARGTCSLTSRPLQVFPYSDLHAHGGPSAPLSSTMSLSQHATACIQRASHVASVRPHRHSHAETRLVTNELTGDGMFGPIAGRILHPLPRPAGTPAPSQRRIAPRVSHVPWATDARPER
ncbi:hypothetical protein DENSPDRAFT_887099 [Dentipellis sp. KUC8613]|nr:hypothetical protein DENSPDRAFT_887099 [Dentipellis sp. KUC8613]